MTMNVVNVCSGIILLSTVSNERSYFSDYLALTEIIVELLTVDCNMALEQIITAIQYHFLETTHASRQPLKIVAKLETKDF